MKSNGGDTNVCENTHKEVLIVHKPRFKYTDDTCNKIFNIYVYYMNLIVNKEVNGFSKKNRKISIKAELNLQNIIFDHSR